MIRRAAIVAVLLAAIGAGAEMVGIRIKADNVGTSAVAQVATASERGDLRRLVITNSTLLPVQIESASDGVQVYATTGLLGRVVVTNLSAVPVVGIVVKSGLATNLNQTTNSIIINAILEK